MKVSVIIPTLNEESCIAVTLENVIKQKPYEVIVADSHSKDNTVKIARKYKAKIVYAKAGSASFGRNAGANIAKGDILVFLDADTIPLSNTIQVIKKDFSDKNTVGWTCLSYTDSSHWTDKLLYKISNIMVQFSMYTKPHAPGMIIAVRKKVFHKIGGFNEKLSVMEDHQIAMRASNYGKFRFSRKTYVVTSARRLREWGCSRFITYYSKHYFAYFINRKKFYENHGVWKRVG